MEERAAKYCGKCGTELEAGARFCPACGCPVKQQEEPVQQEELVWKEEPVQQEAPVWKEEPAPVPQKQRVKKAPGGRWVRTAIIAAAVVLLLAAAVTAAGSYLGVFGGPLRQISTAIKHTASAESFTADMAVEANGTSAQLSVYAQFDNDPVVWMTGSGQYVDNLMMAFCDGCLASYVDGSYDTFDVQKEIRQRLEEYDISSNQFSNQKDLQSLLDSVKRDVYRVLERQGNVDMEQAEKDLQKLARNMNSKKWMKKNAGYSCKWKDGELIHTLHIDPYTFLMACLECFEDSFYSRSDYYDVQDLIMDAISDAGRIDLTLSVQNGKISAFTYMVDDVIVTGTLRGVGSTVIDEREIRAFCDKARNS